MGKVKHSKKDVPLHSSLYEQESMLEFKYRAEYMLSKIIAENEEDNTIVIVTRGGMINQLYRAFFRLPVDSEYAFWTGDTGIHEWMIGSNSRIVVKANMCA